MNRSAKIGLSKVPEVTLAFWIIKIVATTLGETGPDALSMTIHLGYAISTVVFFAFFIVTVAAQVTAKSFHPFLYWAVIVATTTAGTTIADYADRSLGIGYLGGSLILFTTLMIVLGLWWLSVGSVSVNNIVSHWVEIFYWVTILFSNTLGTALGNFLADSGLGYRGAAIVFAGVLVLVAAVYFYTKASPALFFWLAFSSPVRSARRSAIFSPSPLQAADSISAASDPLWSSQFSSLAVSCSCLRKPGVIRESLGRAIDPPSWSIGPSGIAVKRSNRQTPCVRAMRIVSYTWLTA